MRSGLPLSRLIRWAFDTDCSHFAVCFDNKLVIHSDLLGVKLAWWNSFEKSHTIVHCLEFDLGLDKEELIYRSIMDNFDGDGYDFSAFLYFAYRAILWKIFTEPMPKVNPWNDKNKFLCTEVFQFLPEWVVKRDKGADLSMTTPHDLFLKVRQDL